jgi:hypothetical protein
MNDERDRDKDDGSDFGNDHHGDERGNEYGDDRGDTRSDGHGNDGGNDRGNDRGNHPGNDYGNDYGNDDSNDQGNGHGNHRGNHRGNVGDGRSSDYRPPAGYPSYSGYDVLDKRNSPSWDDATRAVLDARIAIADEPAWCSAAEWRVLRALCDVIVPQPAHRPAVPLAALVDRKIAAGHSDGYRHARLPPLQRAWRIGLAALDDESRQRHRASFADLDRHARLGVVQALQHGTLTRAAWQQMPSQLFFTQRVLRDICTIYFAHPSSWSDIGFGGPANPRGYVRMSFNRRDPWEARETPAAQAPRADVHENPPTTRRQGHEKVHQKAQQKMRSEAHNNAPKKSPDNPQEKPRAR